MIGIEHAYCTVSEIAVDDRRVQMQLPIQVEFTHYYCRSCSSSCSCLGDVVSIDLSFFSDTASLRPLGRTCPLGDMRTL